MSLLKDRVSFLPDDLVDPKPFTPDIHGLIAWLETQDGDIAYCWSSVRNCLLARYATLCGLDAFWQLNMGDLERAEVSYFEPWTYSAALSRARAFAAKMGER